MVFVGDKNGFVLKKGKGARYKRENKTNIVWEGGNRSMKLSHSGYERWRGGKKKIFQSKGKRGELANFYVSRGGNIGLKLEGR